MTFHMGEALVAVLYIFLPLILGLLHAHVTKKDTVATLLNYYVFISVGIQGWVTGLLQAGAPNLVLYYTHWRYSLFLIELGIANVSFGAIGVLSPWLSHGWKAASATGYGLFLFLTGVGHLVDIAINGPTPGSAGAFLFSDLLIPVALWTLLILQGKKEKTTFNADDARHREN